MTWAHGTSMLWIAIGVISCCATMSLPTHAFDNWLSRRDAGIVKQQRDYSCGAAALATVLTHFYNDPVSEEVLLQQLLSQRRSAGAEALHSQGLSFADMASLARARDYPVLGVELAYQDLKRLAVPVIVALRVAGRAHFSVLRRINNLDRIFLADPSWGNRQLGKEEFLKIFARTEDNSTGRILIVGAKGPEHGDDAFRHRPSRRVLIAPRH
ncbi:C39 family peptidase [Congregibacter sp.]|uniref:C39 family peptidase n=1 Tax=Congregibacter sp. TaxID=2744308 RepID=UPI003F6CF3CB